MKKLLGIVVLGLLLSGNAYANNLTGKQLQCTTSSSNIEGFNYYKFTTDKEVINLYIFKKTLNVGMKRFKYKVFPTDIEIHWGDLKMATISRKSLKTLSGESCKIVKFDVKNHLEKKSKQLLEKISKDNKI